jgi:hypothetical protein
MIKKADIPVQRRMDWTAPQGDKGNTKSDKRFDVDLSSGGARSLLGAGCLELDISTHQKFYPHHKK